MLRLLQIRLEWWTLILCFASIAVPAQSNTTNLTVALQLLQSMPECGRTCLLDAISISPCEATDIECSCHNDNITTQTEACVLDSCTIKESLTTKNTTYTLCGRPVRDGRGPGQRNVITGLTFSTLAYVIRIASKLSWQDGRVKSTLWWDDAMITFVMGLVFPISFSAVLLNREGLSTDVWTVPFDNITRILKIYYWDEDLYLSALPAVKISLLLTYLRIFGHDRKFRHLVYIVIALNVGYWISFVLISVFQCLPIECAWLRWSGEYPCRCNHINAQGWAAAALNVVLDIMTLSLPLPSLYRMQLNKRKKFWVILMFCVGFFVTVVSILRLQVLIQFGDSHNLTWDYTAVGYWSTIELHVSVVCACMPAIRNLLRRFIPTIMGQSTAKTGDRGASTGRSGRASTGGGKFGNSVTIRARGSDEIDIITLQDYTPGSRDTDQSHGEPEVRVDASGRVYAVE
ncbi:Satratoxin biosynthesis SC1 cluster protein 4 [Pseudocercospora fuligena]|uniref:Satratoxin biosynthesis SC1 cluster protein 4 n=1 Tax=Pseudocercospora fuligena TaxID=685502 RepID=A0A8H6RTZ0_9PEZI|nr:Satratoxin biosynthesis SC1 cluster protein 4 [Pseudocercospora fuligena]